MNTIKIVQIGMGPLGIKIGEFIAERQGLETVSAVDKNPELIGRKLCALSTQLSDQVVIKGSIEDAIKEERLDVAILTTVSDMERITPQIIEILKYKIPIVSTCEELSYPWRSSNHLAQEIDKVAKKNEIAVVGTGVNPGFLMDALPSFLSSVCQNVEKVHIKRFQDAEFRRIPFQKKIGAGLTVEEFEQRKKAGTLRHVGLTESMHFIAETFGWELDSTVDEISPVLAKQNLPNNGLEIKAGNATGVCQIGKAFIGDAEKIILEFQATVGEESSYDEVEIQGTPNIKSRIEGGINGDVATCAITVNSTRQILKAQPGLRIMADIPLVTFFG